MKRVLFALALMLTACGSQVDDSANDASPPSDTASTDAPHDVEFMLDTPLDPTCPKYFPGDGLGCTATIPCSYMDSTCGGAFTATCVGGVWTSTSKPTCAYCPQSKPAPDSSCASEPTGLTCTFWPISKDACETCTCTDGKWACTTPSSCPLTMAECTNGTACAPLTGCGAGRCSNYCACGVDGKLHCTSTLC